MTRVVTRLFNFTLTPYEILSLNDLLQVTEDAVAIPVILM